MGVTSKLDVHFGGMLKSRKFCQRMSKFNFFKCL